MEILLSGAICQTAADIASFLGASHKVVMTSTSLAHIQKDRRVICFEYAFDDELYPKLFSTYNFDVALFALRRGEQERHAQAGSLDELDTLLNLCRENRVSSVIILSSSEVYSSAHGQGGITEQSEPRPAGHSGFLLRTAETLCEHYRRHHKMNIVSLRLPYVFSAGDSDSLVCRAVQAAAANLKVVLPGRPDTLVDFIRGEDLAELVWRIIDEGYSDGNGIINVGSERPIHMVDFANILKKEFPGITVSYTENEADVPVPVHSETSRHVYDWLALHHIRDALPEIVREIQGEPARRSPWVRLKNKLRVGGQMIRSVEFVAGMAFTEVLARAMTGFRQFQSIDIRLLFIIIMGHMHGMRMGVLAALYASVSMVLANILQGQDWRVLVYNPESWIPFILYLVVGIVTGYSSDKNAGERKQDTQQMESLEQNYLFLFDLYNQTLQNKSRYRDQIVGYRDSFGRIFRVTQRLDSLLPDEVFTEAVNVLEDILGNHSIAIYTVSRGEYARLIVRSRALRDARLSLHLPDYDIPLRTMLPGGVWFNRDLLRDHPMYCAPVYAGGEPTALIMIYEAKADQMSEYYMNLIRVLAGLIQASLARAAEYNAAIEERRYIADTRILYEDAFLTVYEARQKMEEEQFLDFALLAVGMPEDPVDVAALSGRIEQCIRETDVIGMVNGTVYLMLTQTTQEGVAFVMERLAAAELQCVQMATLNRQRPEPEPPATGLEENQ